MVFRFAIFSHADKEIVASSIGDGVRLLYM